MSKTSQQPRSPRRRVAPAARGAIAALTILALPLLLAACRDGGAAGSAEKAQQAPVSGASAPRSGPTTDTSSSTDTSTTTSTTGPTSVTPPEHLTFVYEHQSYIDGSGTIEGGTAWEFRDIQLVATVPLTLDPSGKSYSGTGPLAWKRATWKHGDEVTTMSNGNLPCTTKSDFDMTAKRPGRVAVTLRYSDTNGINAPVLQGEMTISDVSEFWKQETTAVKGVCGDVSEEDEWQRFLGIITTPLFGEQKWTEGSKFYALRVPFPGEEFWTTPEKGHIAQALFESRPPTLDLEEIADDTSETDSFVLAPAG
ncbi:MAG: hypothetical protein J0I11_04315 [Actinobacteria bacterium]|jgi:hypothetical protein|nr:hypothetical protein [Actinomycetota bacterium]